MFVSYKFCQNVMRNVFLFLENELCKMREFFFFFFFLTVFLALVFFVFVFVFFTLFSSQKSNKTKTTKKHKIITLGT